MQNASDASISGCVMSAVTSSAAGGRYEGDAQAFSYKHHHDLPSAAFFRQIFGVSAETSCACARVVDDAFVQRRGNDAVENAV